MCKAIDRQSSEKITTVSVFIYLGTNMPSITYNRTNSQQPQNFIIDGYVIRPGLHILSHEQIRLVREQIQHNSQLEYFVSQGVIKLIG